MNRQYSITASFTAYLTSWGSYYNGQPLRPYKDATVRRKSGRDAALWAKHIRVYRKQMEAVRLQEPLFVRPDTLLLENNNIVRQTVANINRHSPVTQLPSLAKPDELVSSPSSLAQANNKLTKRKRTLGHDDEPTRRLAKKPRPSAKQTASDEEIARRLHLEMNGRVKRRGSK
ncbi:hypothetical protein LTR78_006417 [Recurvomyces mirabilis]|uniref:Uncharacterized protein n=1 Tax=Recurvomyces mirabilis TaxID=574656 RepID=A0AAE0WLD6_9PEZI|nr:hypothetical protein LTR78_006417 [Recurvomyces mirabilis]KAK5152304.1 hypothetical protein LTS14_008681 [Recurvomyces mirabilis]